MIAVADTQEHRLPEWEIEDSGFKPGCAFTALSYGEAERLKRRV